MEHETFDGCRAQVPLQFKLGPLTTISIGIGLLARGGKGATYRKSNLPKEPIEIWGYEASPFVKLTREASAAPARGPLWASDPARTRGASA